MRSEVASRSSRRNSSRRASKRTCASTGGRFGIAVSHHASALTNDRMVRYAAPMPTGEPALLYEKQDGIAVLTMNRPAVHNALNAEMLCRLADAWQDVNDDPAVRCAILTGAGDAAFCAGADLDRLVRMMQGLRPPETDFDRRIVEDYTLIY